MAISFNLPGGMTADQLPSLPGQADPPGVRGPGRVEISVVVIATKTDEGY
jgi:hypothetical protein